MNIGIVGLGLIGGSLGMATGKYTENKVYGFDLDYATIEKALTLNAINYELNDKNVAELDVLILATFPKSICKLLSEYAPKMKSGAIITDISGVKSDVVATMQELAKIYPKLNFISAHPMAGREVSGIENAKADLFNNCFIITVNVNCIEASVVKLTEYFKAIGANDVVMTSVENHDKMISYTSQLAHIVSSSYIKNELSKTHAGYSAGSFLDMTRVARLNPTMWTELCLENRFNLSNQIDDLIKRLSEFKIALDKCDDNELYSLFLEAAQAKEIADKNLQEKRNANKG